MGGAALPLGPIIFIILIVLVIVGLFVVFPWAKSENRRVAKVVHPDTEALAYRVPEGQDPAAVVAALAGDGITASATARSNEQLVLIPLVDNSGDVRSRARDSIAQHANLNLDRDPAPAAEVRFADE